MICPSIVPFIWVACTPCGVPIATYMQKTHVGNIREGLTVFYDDRTDSAACRLAGGGFRGAFPMSTGNGLHFHDRSDPGGATGRRLDDCGPAVVARQRGDAQFSGAARRAGLPCCTSAGWGVFCGLTYPLLAVAPLAALGALGRGGGHLFVTRLGVNCAIVGFTLLCMQFLLTARLKWIEAPFGLDVVMRFHRTMALVIVALLCAHPMLVAAGQGWGLLTRLNARGYIWAGRIALLLLAAQVVAALLRERVRLKYETWRRSHNLIALAILAAGFTHSVMAGEDLHGRLARILWAAAPAVALATWLCARLIRPRLLARRAFRVVSMRFDTPCVCTLTLVAPAGRPFDFLPGQFQFLRFIRSGVPAEEHPFTIASSPTCPDRISLTIKDCGDFTTLLDRARAGDLATVHGPFGRFSHDLHPDEGDLVFVGGGVGITPLMSMLRAMRDRRERRRVTLVYACRGPEDVLFADELGAMETDAWPMLRVIHVLSRPRACWDGESGHVDAGRLETLCAGLEGKAFYICCPSRMTRELVRGLRRRGVHPRRIHCDYFSL